jgi:hypothetical protein
VKTLGKIDFKALGILFIMSILFACHTGDPVDPIDQAEYSENPVNISIINPIDGAIPMNALTVSGVASSINNIDKVEVAIDNNDFQVADGDINWTLSTPIDPKMLPVGVHRITARATDSQSFVKSTTISFHVKNDLSIVITSPDTGSLLLNNANYDVEGIVKGFYTPFQKLEVWVDSEYQDAVLATIETEQNEDGTWSWLASVPFTNLDSGDHVVKAQVTDSYAVDSSPPNTAIDTTQIAIENDILGISIISPIDNSDVSGDVLIRGAAVAENTPFVVDICIDGGSWTPANGTSAWDYSWDTEVYANGVHKIKARITDSKNNERIDTIILNLKPILVKISSPSPNQVVNSGNLTISGFAHSSHEIMSVDLYIDNQGPQPVTSGSLNLWTYSGAYFGLTGNGFHLIQAIGQDAAGNTDTDEVIVSLSGCPPILVLNTGNAQLVGMDNDQGSGWLLYSLSPYSSQGFTAGDLGDCSCDSQGRIYVTKCWWAGSGAILRLDDMYGSSPTILNTSGYFTDGLYIDRGADILYWMSNGNTSSGGSSARVRKMDVADFSTGSPITTSPQFSTASSVQGGDIFKAPSTAPNPSMFYNTTMYTSGALRAFNTWPPMTITYNATVGSTSITNSTWTTPGECAAVVVDQSGNVYVTFMDIGAVLVLDPNLTSAIGYYEDPGFTASWDVFSGIDISSAGKVYVCAMSNDRIVRYDSIGWGSAPNRTILNNGSSELVFNEPHEISFFYY